MLAEIERRALASNPSLQAAQGSTTTPTPPPAPAASAQDEDSSLRFYNLGLNANWEIDLAGGQARTIEAANALAAAAA